LQLIESASVNRQATAIVAQGKSWTYEQLLVASAATAGTLLDTLPDLNEARVAFLMPPGFDYVQTQWAVWRAGGVAVPLALQHPSRELEHVIADSQASLLIVHPTLEDRLQPLARQKQLQLIRSDQITSDTSANLPHVVAERRALMLYTSGTTGRPKGVVTTHANIQAQAEALIAAWEWTAADRILHMLPLHHIHGIINVLTCALSVGATCEFMDTFTAEGVWNRIRQGGLTLVMAVPTIYSRLIDCWNRAEPAEQLAGSAACRKLRLMVSGSAALPVPTLEAWQHITGHVLLERYGMTEIGMALSNPLHGKRVPGHVGHPLPGVEVRRRNEHGAPAAANEPGEIQVRGPGVFREYWNRPEETQNAFEDGWFRTGDIAVETKNAYRILGRSSVDIIKTGGYKVSALEIEDVLRTHPDIGDCAVVGIDDQRWGQLVSACVVGQADAIVDLVSLRAWCRDLLADYKIPRQLMSVEQLPRNALGKTQKPRIVALFEAGTQHFETHESA
jgi:malonyl-CoA/methylmalonyl-CoA synthetase